MSCLSPWFYYNQVLLDQNRSSSDLEVPQELWRREERSGERGDVRLLQGLSPLFSQTQRMPQPSAVTLLLNPMDLTGHSFKAAQTKGDALSISLFAAD